MGGDDHKLIAGMQSPQYVGCLVIFKGTKPEQSFAIIKNASICHINLKRVDFLSLKKPAFSIDFPQINPMKLIQGGILTAKSYLQIRSMAAMNSSHDQPSRTRWSGTKRSTAHFAAAISYHTMLRQKLRQDRSRGSLTSKTNSPLTINTSCSPSIISEATITPSTMIKDSTNHGYG